MTEPRSCAVIFNPTKVADNFNAVAGVRLLAAGYAEPRWLETTPDDPGYAMTTEAREAQVDLVVVAGGDGTVRIVAAGLAGTGIPLGIVPAGTGNLLARNLSLPLEADAALDVICAGNTHPIDMIVLTVDDHEPHRFMVMAGTGLDAVIMDETNDALKSAIGPAAYFVAATKAVGRLPVAVRIKVDGHRSHRRRCMICLIGNVGQLTGGIHLMPQARPDDGLLDVYVASPHRFKHWVKTLLRLITRRPQADDHVDVWVGKRVEIELSHPDTYQLDGDVEGECRRMVAEVDPGSLVVCLPA